MDAEARKKELIALDGAALAALALRYGLAPAWRIELDEQGRCRYYDALYDRGQLWTPYDELSEAEAVFRSLRARGYTTSCCWFGDDRQYGDAFVGGVGDWRASYGVRWPLDVKTEAMALLMVSVLAVEGERAAAERALPPAPEEG